MHFPSTPKRIDWSAERERVDLAALATRLLGPAPGRRGDRSSRRLWWFCPFHQESNPSFCVEVGKPWWRCRGCGEHGDAIDLVRKLDPGLSFPQAVAVVTGQSGVTPAKRPVASKAPGRPPEPPAAPIDPAVVEAAKDALWGDGGAAAQAYLNGRGLTDDTIRAAHLGYSDGRGDCHRGITIPWGDPHGWRFVNVRRPEGCDPKYLISPKGARKGGLYPGPDTIVPGLPLVIVEGELDCLLLAQELAGLASVITFGSAADHHNLAPADLAAMLSASRWYVATDADRAGEAAAAKLMTHSSRLRRVRPPGASKDWTEAFVPVEGTIGTGMNLRRWWTDVLSGQPSPSLYTWDELASWRWGPAVEQATEAVA